MLKKITVPEYILEKPGTLETTLWPEFDVPNMKDGL